MKLSEVINFCREFSARFSALNLRHLQLEFHESPETASISLACRNEACNTEAVLAVSHDTVRLLKINCFEPVDCHFTFSSKLELYAHLLRLLVKSCEASGIFVSPFEALNATLGRKINDWRELVVYVCSLLPEEQGAIEVLASRYNALWLLATIFFVHDGVFVADGFFRRQIEYENSLDLIISVLETVSGLLKIFGYEVDPLSGDSLRNLKLHPGLSS